MPFPSTTLDDPASVRTSSGSSFDSEGHRKRRACSVHALAIACLSVPAPFGIWTGFALHRDRVFVIDAAANGFSLYTPDGRLLATYRGTPLARPVTSRDRRLYIEALMKRHPAWAATEEAPAEYERIQYPESMSAFREAVVATDGVVWIEPYELWDGAQRHFVGYDSTGLAVARLSLQYHDRIMEIGDGTILLLNVAEDGVETIRVARYTF